MSFVLRTFLGAVFLAGLAATLSGAPEESVFVRDYYAAYSAHDAGRIAAFYGPEATFDDPSFGLALRGAKQIHDLFAAVLTKYQSLDFVIEHVTTSGETRVVEAVMIGKIGEKTVRVHFVSVFSFAGDRIVAQRDLYDVLHFYSQLGVVPPEFRSAIKQN